MLQKFGFVVHQPGALGEGRHKKPNITITDEICGSYKMAHHFSESGDDIAECSQWLVNVGSFFEPNTAGTGGVSPLTAC